MNCWHANYPLQTIQIQLPSCFCLINVGTLVIKQYEINTKANGQANAENNAYSLKGYGASIAWQGPYRTHVKATYAHRFGHNPNPTNTGNDQDGSKRYDVLWLNGGVNF